MNRRCRVGHGIDQNLQLLTRSIHQQLSVDGSAAISFRCDFVVIVSDLPSHASRDAFALTARQRKDD